MYVPPAFKIDNLTAVHDMMRAVSLATLVTMTDGGLLATPLPLLLDSREGAYGTLYGHLARSNEQWRTIPSGDTLAIFMGPDAYVSPSWYAAKRAHGKVVPTWNYAAVHAYGPVEFFEDAGQLLEVVTRLTELHEGARAAPWAVGDAPAKFIEAQLRGIVGVRLPITRLEGKLKMSQNRDAADRAGVRAGLAASDRQADRHVSTLIPV